MREYIDPIKLSGCTGIYLVVPLSVTEAYFRLRHPYFKYSRQRHPFLGSIFTRLAAGMPAYYRSVSSWIGCFHMN